ncbi:MAG: fasciclin domain-containing protein [Acidimicrobiia bacterium]|nr:fasciclin domain-containing protein [Acidimicrobiia bacterium]
MNNMKSRPSVNIGRSLPGRRRTRRRSLTRGPSLAALALAVALTACAGTEAVNVDEQAGATSTNSGDKSLDAQEPATEEGTEEASGEATAGQDDGINEEAEEEAPNALAVVDEADSVLAVIADHPDLTTFAALVADYPQRQVFTQARGVTILVPNDAAFDALGPERVQLLADDSDAFTLFLSAHMAVGPRSLDSLLAGGVFANALAQQLTVATGEDTVTVAEASIVESDLTASNGVIHVIDAAITS